MVQKSPSSTARDSSPSSNTQPENPLNIKTDQPHNVWKQPTPQHFWTKCLATEHKQKFCLFIISRHAGCISHLPYSVPDTVYTHSTHTHSSAIAYTRRASHNICQVQQQTWYGKPTYLGVDTEHGLGCWRRMLGQMTLFEKAASSTWWMMLNEKRTEWQSATSHEQLTLTGGFNLLQSKIVNT